MRVTIALPALCLAARIAAAAAPANDEWTNAVRLPVTGAALGIDTTGATAVAADPGCGGAVHQSIWYAYTSPVDQFIQARVSETTGSTPLRPRLSAWTLGPAGQWVAADCHPDAHEVHVDAAAGSTVYLLVSSPVPDGLARLNLNVNPNAFVNPGEPPAPKNNLFWYAEPVDVLPAVIRADLGAGRGDPSYDPGVCGGPRSFVLGDTLWYRFTSPITGSVDALFDSPYSGPYVGVFTGDLDHLSFVACDQIHPARDGAARFQAVAGQSYLVEFGAGVEIVGSQMATLRLRATPPPTGGAIAHAPTVGSYKRVVFVPDVGYKIVTHLLLTLDLRCDAPVPSVVVGATVQQAGRTVSKQQNVGCSGGSARLTMDLSDAKGFVPGAATVTATGFDFDANFDVRASGGVAIVRGRP